MGVLDGLPVGVLLGLPDGLTVGVALGFAAGFAVADGFCPFGVTEGVAGVSVIPTVGVLNITSNDGWEGRGDTIPFARYCKITYPPTMTNTTPSIKNTNPLFFVRDPREYSPSIIIQLYPTPYLSQNERGKLFPVSSGLTSYGVVISTESAHAAVEFIPKRRKN